MRILRVRYRERSSDGGERSAPQVFEHCAEIEHFDGEMFCGVGRSETPPRRRSSRNSLAALSSDGGVKPAADIFNGKTLQRERTAGERNREGSARTVLLPEVQHPAGEGFLP